MPWPFYVRKCFETVITVRNFSKHLKLFFVTKKVTNFSFFFFFWLLLMAGCGNVGNS